jgi:peptidoglycan/xylan/chitin deacetylase (PgdA/CDA1 family)/ribosomal protein L17
MSETQEQLEQQQPSSSSSPSSESYYVTYGVLENNQEYVDWFRFDYSLETNNSRQDDQKQDSSSNNNPNNETAEDFDKRAFEHFRFLSLYNTLQYSTTNDNDNVNDVNAATGSTASASASASVIEKSKILIDGLVTVARQQKKDNRKNNLNMNNNLNLQNNLWNNVKNNFNLNLNPNTVSYIVFDSQWNPLRFSPRYTTIDIAILLQAAAMNEQQNQQRLVKEQPQTQTQPQTQKQQHENELDDTSDISGDDGGGGNDGEKNNDNDNQDDDDDGGGNEHTSTSQNGSSSSSSCSCSHNRQSVLVGDFDLVQVKIQQGILPIVPIRRWSLFQQSIIKKSVDLFFTKELIPFFACFPFRYSPRTIYRFDFLYNNNTTTTTTTTRIGESAAAGGETRLEEEAEADAEAEYAGTNSHTKIKTTTTVAKQNIRNFVTKTSFKAKKDSLFASIQSLRRSSNLNNSKLFSRTKEKSTTSLPTTVAATATATAATATSPSLPSPQSQKQQQPPILQDNKEDYDDEYDYDGYIALTIDDVPCRFNNTIKQSKMQDVLSLLKKYNAKATFMIISNYVTTAITDNQNQNQTQNEYQNQNNINTHQNDMIQLLQDGHELANHGIVDEAMDSLSKIEFQNAINECNDTIYQLQSLAGINTEKVKVKWFRAPQARYTQTMEEVLEENNMYNVMCDCYAACPVIEDGRWIGQSLTKQVLNNKSKSKSGSIVLLHMPEKGFREYCFMALEILLQELCEKRNYKICTVADLQHIQQQQQQSNHNNV